MTDRELLALVVVGLPALAAVLLALAPHRLVNRLALACALPVGAVGLALAGWALADPEGAEAGTWIVVDAAGGLLVAAIALVGLASVLVSPAALRALPGSLVSGGEARPHLLRRPVRVLVDPARRPAGRKSRRRLAARRSDDRHFGHPRRVQRQAESPRGGLEVPHPHLARARRRTARDCAARGRSPHRRARRPHLGRAVPLRRRPGHRARRLPPAPGRPRRQDRLGTRAQLAARRPLGGASAGLRAPLRRAVARRAARRLALD